MSQLEIPAPTQIPQPQGPPPPPPTNQQPQYQPGQPPKGGSNSSPQGPAPNQQQQRYPPGQGPSPNLQQQQYPPGQGPPRNQQQQQYPPGQGPPPNQQQQQYPPGQGRPPNQQQQQYPPGQGPAPNQQQQYPGPPPQGGYVPTACCGDCPLHEGVAWIASTEFIWSIILAIVCLSVIVTGKSAKDSFEKGISPDEKRDLAWKIYIDAQGKYLYVLLGLHIAELVLSIFLMLASSQRNRVFCFLYIAAISLISVGIIGVIIWQLTDRHEKFVHGYVGAIMIPFRIYFIYIVWALSAEILVYPRGPPVRIVMQNTVKGGMTSPPVIVGTRSYGYSPAYYGGGYGYGYGYPYGYGYGNDVALGVGLGLGVGYGYGGYYGGGYYGGGYYDGGYYDGGYGGYDGGYYDGGYGGYDGGGFDGGYYD